MKNYTLIKTSLFCLSFILLSTSLTQAQIVVNTDFEGGNGIATFTDVANNEVHLTSELKGGDTKNIVYYAEISGLDPSKPLIIKIFAEWSGHDIVYSYDNIIWHKERITNLNNFNIPLTSSSVYVAHSYPYTYSMMISDVNAISELSYVNVYDLAISEGERPVKLVKVTDDCIDDEGKELIWVFGRMHAFENPGNISVIGMLNYFTSNQESAERLRKEAIIYLVPMMDVDMAYIGGSGKDQTPMDFNRDWLYLNEESHLNAVKAAKIWIDSTAQLNNFSVFFDSHSPPPSHGTSLFYYMYDNNHQHANADFINETVLELGNYRGDDYLYTGLDISTSQDYVISIYDNPRHYNVTMETGFGYRPDGEEWTMESYLLHGEYHGRAISDFIHGHAYEDDILIDNNDTENVVLSGNWITDASIFGYFGDDYLYAETDGSASISFNATIDSAGTYEVFTRWVSDADFATNAQASFNYSGGTADFILNMTSRGGKWISLDTYYFDAGEEVSLTISNSDANQTIIADGLRISSVNDCPTLSIQEFEQSLFNFNLYPNPTTNQFTIQLENNTHLEQVKIYDAFGKLVLEGKETLINTSALSTGLYIVVVQTNQRQGAKKLIIQ